MRTYKETYERILSKKAIAEKERRAKKKRIITSLTVVSCLGICLVALFAISKARIGANLNKNDMPDVDLIFSSSNSTKLAETPSAQTSAKPNGDAIDPNVGEDEYTRTINSPTGQNNSTTSFVPQIMTTDVHGGEDIPDWKKMEMTKNRKKGRK